MTTHRTKKRTARKPAKPSTALAIRKRTLPARRPRTTLVTTEKIPPTDLNVLGEDAALGALGLVEVKLTPAEEAVLARPAPIDSVQMKPTGQPYLSHPFYTRWLNDAFGRLGWAIVPRSKPMRSGNSVVCPYVLYIHGQPAAFAMGEQEYHESNREQTYGDALEATVASALRRCCKRLGVGLELWDREWLDKFIDDRCVRVECDVRGERKQLWRRTTDRPLRGEIQPRPRLVDTKPASQAPTSSGPEISEAQLRRLWVLIHNARRDEGAVKAWLKHVHGIESTKAIPKTMYDAVCKAIESPAQLPTGEREPGGEG
jgi:hypothetical protein